MLGGSISNGRKSMKTAYWPYVLIKGHTDDASTGACAMAAVSWLMHGKHSDKPECACPVLTSFVIPANDAMPADVRQRFLPYLHRIAGSRSEKHEAARTRILWLAAVRIFAPIALDQSGLHAEAEKLRALPDDVSAETAAKAAETAAWAAKAEARHANTVWDAYFAVLDEALSAGPQGEPWSADVMERAIADHPMTSR
jgi:hypothetical protein